MAAIVPLTQEELQQAADAYLANGNSFADGARALGNMPRQTFRGRVIRAAEAGLLGTGIVLPGFRISKTTEVRDEHGAVVREFVQQKPEHGGPFEMPAGQKIKGVSALLDSEGREIIKWVKTDADREAREAAMRAVVDGFKEEIPRVAPVRRLIATRADLASQYTITDSHLGMLAWREESGSDYDLRIAEDLLYDWFAAGIEMAPNSKTAILAQIGDFMHHDSHEAVTPAHRHILDSDSRLQKIIRVAIRALRRITAMLLEKHDNVHMIMADANHDPASEAWLREMFAAFYENEPRVTVDRTAGTYYAFEWGLTSLFYHHGHKRRVGNVDSVFAGLFREMYGRTKFSYAHLGHLHSDELKSSNLMKIERHETLAARDAYAANGGWLSGRSAKIITYSKKFGEVGRLTLTPEMVAGAYDAANDNGEWTDVGGGSKVRVAHG